MSELTQTSIAELEMVEGYLDGFGDDRQSLPEYNNFSPAYSHGWMNGRDDRTQKPRAFAQTLRDQADSIINADKREFN